SYSGSRLEELNQFANDSEKTLWMCEFGAGWAEEHNHQDMTSVMELAEKITFDLRILQPSAWVYWQAVEDESAQNNWGVIHSDFMTEESYELTKQYYAMSNFSKFIRPGSSIILPDSARSVAAYNKEEKQLTIVITNDSNDENALEFDLSEFEINPGSADVYITSEDKDLERSEERRVGKECRYRWAACR